MRGNGSGTLLQYINFPVTFSNTYYALNIHIVISNSEYDVDKYTVLGQVTTTRFRATLDSEVTDDEKSFPCTWISLGN